MESSPRNGSEQSDQKADDGIINPEVIIETEQASETEESESEYIRSTRRAAENSKRLGFTAETFSALSLRDRTVLSFLDIQEDIQEDPEQQNGSFVFMDNGVQYGDILLPYTTEIQKAIHEANLENNLHSQNFGKKLLEENQGWQESIIADERKSLTEQATPIFQSIMHSRYANPAELTKISGLSESEFLELLRAEERFSTSRITEEFLKKADIHLTQDEPLKWHLENAKYFRIANTDKISKAEFDTALNYSLARTDRMRAIKKVYDIFIDSFTKTSYRPFKKTPVHPYRLTLKYYAEQTGEVFRDQRRFHIELDQHYDTPKTSLLDAIDSVALFSEQNDIPLSLGDIDLSQEQEPSPEQTERFIEDNAVILNDFCNDHLLKFHKAKSSLSRYISSLTLHNSFPNDESFREKIKQNPYYEKCLKELHHEARYLEIIQIIYGSTSSEYQQRLKENKSKNEKYNIIQNEFNGVLDEAQAQKVPLRGETTRLSDAQLTLSTKYEIKQNISENATEIILANHGKFLAELREMIEEQAIFKQFQKRYFAQIEAGKTLDKRIQASKSSAKKSEYLKELDQLSVFDNCVTKIKQNIRKEFYKQQSGTPEHLDVVRNALDLPFRINNLNLPKQDTLINELQNLLQKHNITDNPKQYIRELIEAEERSCELKTKLATGCEMDLKREFIKTNKRNALYDENSEEYNRLLHPTEASKAWADSYARGSLFQGKIALIAQSLGYHGTATNILFTPGYAICFDETDRSEILPIDTKSFENSETSEMQFLTTIADKPPFRSDSEVAIARKILNRRLETEVLQNEVVGANSTEKRALEIQEKFSVSLPFSRIEPNSGSLERQITNAELKALDTVLPFFGKFVTRIEKSTDTSSTPDSLVSTIQASQKAFICGDTTKKENFIFVKDETGRNIKTGTLASILRAKSIPSTKTLELLAYDAAICDMSTMKQDEINEFQKLMQGKLPADPRTFMLLYQKNITNPVKLHECALRLGYCREFARYCAGGTSSPELKAFFDERARKAKQ